METTIAVSGISPHVTREFYKVELRYDSDYITEQAVNVTGGQVMI